MLIHDVVENLPVLEISSVKRAQVQFTVAKATLDNAQDLLERLGYHRTMFQNITEVSDLLQQAINSIEQEIRTREIRAEDMANERAGSSMGNADSTGQAEESK